MLTVKYMLLILICGPVPINSGYRSFYENARVGGVPNSKHLTGEAFDLGLHGDNRNCILRYSRGIFSKVLIYRNHIHVE